MLLTSVFAEIDTAVVFEVPKVAISAVPFGMVIGFQFAAVFQSLLAGLRFQVALPPRES
jgi:ABC-type transporter Mla maintaining outer membrane lipid asymmetry permease subunit MlaE